VDGKDVSALDSYFELTPGCHVVEPDRQLIMSTEVIAFSASLSTMAFAFPMRAGFAYSVVVEMQEGMSNSARLRLYGAEADAQGNRTKTFQPLPPVVAANVCSAGGTLTN
jgi:hypothetical protein